MGFNTTNEIYEELPALINRVEKCIQEDPNHIDWYLAAKRALEEADWLLYHCMHE